MNLMSYILAAMLSWSPLHAHIKHEDPVKRLARYQSIASDIAEVANDPNETPAFSGNYAREQTGLLLASIAWHESGFHENVDTGIKRGDSGRSVCIMQVMSNQYGTLHNYTIDYLLKDRKNCIRAALGIARNSRCKGGINTRMRAYASGSCSKREDPIKEAQVAKAARGLTRGYVLFYYSNPMKLLFQK